MYYALQSNSLIIEVVFENLSHKNVTVDNSTGKRHGLVALLEPS